MDDLLEVLLLLKHLRHALSLIKTKALHFKHMDCRFHVMNRFLATVGSKLISSFM
jgi:hypothetical protein